MKRIIAFILTSITLATASLHAERVKGFESHPSGNVLAMTVDSIDYRKDLTRVYGSLTGRPHTSARIDGATLDGMECTDIEGVDLNRYFQWEDEGSIGVEIDFPPVAPKRQGTIVLKTPRGESPIVFSRTGR